MMCLLNRSLLNLQTVEDTVVAEHPLFMTLGVRVAPDAALLCLDCQDESLRVGKGMKLKTRKLLQPIKAT